jgi:hypothetical protein
MRNAGNNMMMQNPNQMLDMLKFSMIGSIFGNNKEQSLIYSLMIFIFLSLYEMLSEFGLSYVKSFRENFNKKCKEKILDIGIKDTAENEILLEKNYNDKGNKTNESEKVEAIINYISKIIDIKKMIYKNAQFIVNYKDKILISDDIYFQLESLVLDDNNNLGFISFKILSKNRKIDVLKHFIKRCEEDYELDKQDKLKGKLWFFDNIPNIKQGDNNLLYLRNLFITNRNEKNIFFDNSDVVWRRLYHFMNNKSWYDIKGLPYTLGFLFYGNPGCGKTSMIKAIANITQRHIININFSNIKKKSQLKQLFYDIDLLCTNNYTTEILKIPIKDRLYVFEDIDCVNNIKVLKQRDFKKPATKAEGPKIKPDKKFDHLSQQMFNSNNVTNEEEEDDDDIDLSTVLNILDGTLENPNRIIIFTSNFPEILDKALIRPGRIDMMIEFKLASHKIIIDMYKSYYEEEPDSELVNNIPEDFWTPAELSQIYFNNLDNPKNSLEFLANKDNKIIFQAKNMVVEEPVAQVAPKISICDLNDNVDFPQNIMDFINMNKAKQENKENKIISNDLMAPQAPRRPKCPKCPKCPRRPKCPKRPKCPRRPKCPKCPKCPKLILWINMMKQHK